MARFVFWGCCALMAYLFAIFPAAVVARGLAGRPFRRGTRQPRVSLIIAAHDEEKLIEKKLHNVLELRYPRDRLEVIVASDGSSDRTVELARSVADDRVRVLALPRRGKNATINAAVHASTGDVLVFTDADMAMNPDAVASLVAAFDDPMVGGVAGERRHRRDGPGHGLPRPFRGTSRLAQELLSRGGSITIAGLLYAIRREHFRPVPPSVVDDFYIPSQVILDGRRLVFDARAFTHPLGAPRSVGDPFRRSVRMNVQYVRSYARLWPLFDPRRSGFYAVQLVSHKVLRRFLGIPLLAMMIASLRLSSAARIYRAAAIAQVVFHLAAAAGLVLRALRIAPGPLRAFARYDRELVAAMVGLVAALRGGPADRWEAHRVTVDRSSRGTC